MFDDILEGEQRWLLAYIPIQSNKPHVKCDKELDKIQRNRELGKNKLVKWYFHGAGCQFRLRRGHFAQVCGAFGGWVGL